MAHQTLKLGIWLDSLDVPFWVYDAIHKIAQGNAGEFALIILNEESGKSKANWKNALYYIFNRIDGKLFTKEPDPFATKNISELLAKVPTMRIREKNALNEPDINTIQGYQLDILLRFGSENLRLENRNIARYGIWFLHHGDDRIDREGPPGFWEAVEHWPETTSAVIAAGGKFAPQRVLFRSHFVTYPLSPARHRSYYFWATTPFLSRQIDLLYRLGEEKFLQETEKFNASPLHIHEYEPPSNLRASAAVLKLAFRWFQEFAQRFFYSNQWFLLFTLENGIFPNFKKFIELVPPKGKFWADPHVVAANGNYYIFIEEFADAGNKGHISVIEMNGQGNCKPPVKILEKEYHLSYPFVFEWNGKFYMVPESRANRTIDLYECVEFPCKWSFKQHLMENVSAVDTTLVRHENKWWMFTAIAENEAAAPNVELFLFYADDLFGGKWTAHPKNPIISDVKRARPAGSFFTEDGKIFRPSQDCSRAYGYGFDLNEIESLSETEYREKRVTSVRPDWDKQILGTHTYASCGNLTVIDALKRTPKIG